MWDLPGLGLEPMSTALAGRFLTSVPPGKSPHCSFDLYFCNSDVEHLFMCLLTICHLCFFFSELPFHVLGCFSVAEFVS